MNKTENCKELCSATIYYEIFTLQSVPFLSKYICDMQWE